MQNHTQKWLVVGLLGLCGLSGVAAVQAQSAPTQNAASDTQRDANQQQRIDQGLKSGQLTNREDARMQGRQAHVDHMEHVAGTNNGRVGPREQKRIQRADNRDSKRIYRVKHNKAKR